MTSFTDKCRVNKCTLFPVWFQNIATLMTHNTKLKGSLLLGMAVRPWDKNSALLVAHWDCCFFCDSNIASCTNHGSVFHNSLSHLCVLVGNWTKHMNQQQKRCWTWIKRCKHQSLITHSNLPCPSLTKLHQLLLQIGSFSPQSCPG